MTLLAVDGGNWKTHLALARADGEVLALARGGESSPHLLGEEGALQAIEALLVEAEAAGVTFVKGSDFFADGSGRRALRLAFSFVSPDEIAEGVSRLAAALPARV